VFKTAEQLLGLVPKFDGSSGSSGSSSMSSADLAAKAVSAVSAALQNPSLVGPVLEDIKEIGATMLERQSRDKTAASSGGVSKRTSNSGEAPGGGSDRSANGTSAPADDADKEVTPISSTTTSSTILSSSVSGGSEAASSSSSSSSRSLFWWWRADDSVLQELLSEAAAAQPEALHGLCLERVEAVLQPYFRCVCVCVCVCVCSLLIAALADFFHVVHLRCHSDPTNGQQGTNRWLPSLKRVTSIGTAREHSTVRLCACFGSCFELQFAWLCQPIKCAYSPL